MLSIARKYAIPLILILVVACVFLWVRAHLFGNIALDLEKRLKSLRISGFNVRYDSISVDWRRNIVEIDKLLLEKNAYDTTCVYPEFISVGKVRAEGIGLLELLFQNVLDVDVLYLDNSRLVLRENSLFILDSASQRENEFTLQADRVFFKSAEVTYADSALCEVITGFKSHISLTELHMDFHVDKAFAYTAGTVTLDSAEITMPARYYTFTILQATMDFNDDRFTGRSIRITPQMTKLQFARKHGFEIDCYEADIPLVKADHLSFSFGDSAHVRARAAEIQFYLKVFRDKRLPLKKKPKLLPQDQLRDLPYDLAIDSLKVTKSYVSYEEYAEGASETGRIFFDNLYAVVRNVTNVAQRGNTQLSARADLLGHGDLSLHANFPLDPKERSTVSGSVKNFRIPEINSMLMPTTQIKVESGDLKELSFNFTFNSIRSDGEIELIYENLRLTTFKDETKTKDEEPEKDNLKTFIMNTFIFRKNMHENLPEDKRTGTIMNWRDETRSIFNFWSKSLVSGIKSAYKLDKAEAKVVEKETKKEERASRREARKSKRAAKKKERG